MAPSLEELTALFRKLGARDPQGWASSQVTEGINQLHRYLFLRQAWSLVVAAGNSAWIDAVIAADERQPDASYSGVGPALKRLLGAGASREDLTHLVRGMQAELLFGFCYLLEDPAIEEEDLAHIGWALVETDSDYRPTDRPIFGLHESLWETDPTGPAMRPGTP
jgi:hypothetical protein